MRTALILAILLLLPTAQAQRDTIGYASCGATTVAIRHEQCTGACNGITVIVGSAGNCNGEDADTPGESGESTCGGYAFLLWGRDNCNGVDGMAGPTGGNGGAACAGFVVQLSTQHSCNGGGVS